MNPAPTELESENRRQLRQGRFSRGALVAAIAALVCYGLIRTITRYEITSGLKIALCILLALGFGVALWLGERDLMATEDELAQKIRLEAMAVAFPLSLAIVMFLGTLQHGGITLIAPWGYWIPCASIHGLALAWSKRRYR